MQWPAFVHTGQLFVNTSTFHTDNICTWMRGRFCHSLSVSLYGDESEVLPNYPGPEAGICFSRCFILVNNTHSLGILFTP